MTDIQQQARPAGITARRHGALITPDMLPGDDGANICGPSLMKVPEWVRGRLGAYYLYFAHHNGSYIRLAYADALQGPWRIHPGGALSLAECPFLKEHIASPDLHVDEQNQRIVMYFHGPAAVGGEQMTFAATSADGLHFSPHPKALGPSYARVFRHGHWWYGLFGTDSTKLFRSSDGLSGFEQGPVVLSGSLGRLPPRHLAVQKSGRWLRIFHTRKGDAPERIFHGTIDLSRDWKRWRVRGSDELLRPGTDFEGADLPLRPSRTGAATGRESALRDPAIFEEDGRVWLLYAVAGESGIALAEIVPAASGPAGLSRIAATVEDEARRLARSLGRILGKESAKQLNRIFIAGCARSGTTLTRSLMACFEDIHVLGREAPFPELMDLRPRTANVVVKRTAESHRQLCNLPAEAGLIYCVRHPFDVLTSSHPETKHLRPFHVTPERWEAEYDGLQRLRQVQPLRPIVFLRYEDLIGDPDSAQVAIARAFSLSPRIRFSADPRNQIRTTSLRKWERNEDFRTYLHGLPPAFLARVEAFCREFGYDMPRQPDA
ncbi:MULTISPECIES: sulfotransferase [unclassified Mesorhizobium]|uniref:sulfotransferase family protein n=3 Tax=Mesorhizobium TaxID=68287 RepID=UPI000FE944EC|nr:MULTISPECIES: sulfotransferase [unclassified Mesorhizobium]TGT57036.1 hypothetical protein EN813_039690 [Mesorhizobium sp. M00.F.Ca.ET.170.01.1.1]RWB70643.1 MAG: hypothetical protein EOQ49_17680 [Mesorhizobium sp.]RWB92458.1 MAG: hypothetical protein EOQ52_02845 [Mesorhizobium sp.]RWE19533.1 MAG: hypothetical protein EOS41_30295 [Mesorhizobium sp.]RWE33650.1 MAG: hypothetical protein EOS77_11705 [Mesorhizobium sp.]